MNIEDLDEFLEENPDGVIHVTSHGLNDSIITGHLHSLKIKYKEVNIINLHSKMLARLKISIGINVIFFKNKEIQYHLNDLVSERVLKKKLRELVII